jgi:mannose-1-phosphate guanylyltransferase
MLTRTLERVGQLVAKERIVTIIGSGHRRYLNGEVKLSGLIVEQPANLDTAPGIFLPLAHIMRADPEATVLIFPSDHFIAPTKTFLGYVEQAAELTSVWSNLIILLGAVPDRAEPEFGWIELSHRAGTAGVAQVSGFTEKPELGKVDGLYRDGALWNTMVMAVKAKTLWALGHEHLPEMMSGFEEIKSNFGTSEESAALAMIYAKMKPCNFSKAVLERCVGHTAVIAMKGVMWNDWGRPERIRETLTRTNGHAFASEIA